MSNYEKIIIVDTRALVSLAQAGEAGLDTLLIAEQRIVLLPDVLIELSSPNTPQATRSTIESWISKNEGTGGRLIQPEYRYPNIENRTTQIADYAIRDFAEKAHRPGGEHYHNIAPFLDGGEARYRILSDDQGFYQFETKSKSPSADALDARGQYALPYYGTGEFLGERLFEGDIDKERYKQVREAVLTTNLTDSYRAQWFSDVDLDDYNPNIAEKTGIPKGSLLLSGGVIGLATTIAKQLGIIGDAYAFAETLAHTEQLRTQDKKAEASEVWVKYLFETAGGITGGALGLLGAAYVLKGAGGFWGPVFGAVAGGVLGSLGGAELGGALYKAHPELFDLIFEKIYGIADDLADLDIPPAEAFAQAFIGSFGFTMDAVEGSSGNDWMLASTWGERRGNEGDDVLLGWKPGYVAAGDKVDPANPDSEVASSELRLTLDGGIGDDWVIALGGTGAITVGGLGRDFVFNTSAYGRLYGDTIDGQGVQPDPISAADPTDSDVFWYWPGTFIMDAKPNDILQVFGFPLLGGTNMVAGVAVGDGSLALDWLFPFVFYGATTGGQLLVVNALMAALEIGPEGLEGVMVVEDYTFGGWQDIRMPANDNRMLDRAAA